MPNAPWGGFAAEGSTMHRHAGCYSLCSAPASCPRLILASRGETTAYLAAPTAEAAMRGRREKVFGPGRAVPLDGNTKSPHCRLR